MQVNLPISAARRRRMTVLLPLRRWRARFTIVQTLRMADLGRKPLGIRRISVKSAILATNLPCIWRMSVKIGAKVVSHGRYVAFQMAEVAIPRNLFADILRLIAELRPPPVTSTA
jgi:hypothetical protein